MKTRIFGVLVLVVLVFGLAGGAWAQYESNARSAMGVRVSFLKPFSNPIGQIKGEWMAPGLDYNCQFDSLDRPHLVASVSWLAESNNTKSCKIVPVGVQYIKYLNDSYPSKYVALGGTAYFINYKEYNMFFGWKSDNSRKLGVNLSYGVDFGNWFAEGTYQVSQRMNLSYGTNMKMDGISITIGTRRAL